MRVWLPSVRANSGSDVYVERLAALLANSDIEPIVTWFPLWQELVPWTLRLVSAPPRVDVIHTNSWQGFAFARPTIPLVITIHHCVGGVGYPGWKSKSQSLYHDHWIGPCERKSIRKAAGVVAVSRSTAEQASAHFGINGIRVIENWIEVDSFRPLRAGSAENPAAPKILCVGNLSRRKGADLLPTFRKKLPQKFDLHVVVGRRARAGAEDRLGPGIKVWSSLDRDSLIRLYQQSDIVVSLSRHEGFGYTAAEAMACGKPVIAFDVPGLRDVVTAGKTGVLVQPEDVAAMASACVDLINNPKQRIEMGLNGREWAITHFSPEIAARQYLSIYREVIASRGGI